MSSNIVILSSNFGIKIHIPKIHRHSVECFNYITSNNEIDQYVVVDMTWEIGPDVAIINPQDLHMFMANTNTTQVKCMMTATMRSSNV